MKVLIDINSLFGSYVSNGCDFSEIENVGALEPSDNAKDVLETLCKSHEVNVLADNVIVAKLWLEKNNLKYGQVRDKNSMDSYRGDFFVSPCVFELGKTKARTRVCLSRSSNAQYQGAKVDSLNGLLDLYKKELEIKK